ncbi:DUF499 domain-containing protein [Thermomicrobium sp. 4228-Ro]|uniref:ATP-binding protein n=1 Tax=Thermomicrobium sp. 4228-Ro TaxID=2993937 RepID=UPI002249709F|nr:DUF499 domain-containing protein [Thermomicrobium sp. 4228-Ro]MCX2727443.1 DUF499 domain-containing protein [Thermomicrobium sp. 4228-Ro]
MRSLYETCEPRPEVLQGELREELFAARLKDVLDGVADPVYQDPERFFENTYPTEGLRTLLREVLGRLTGRNPAANPIVRLETPFGGGKTHSLIALYHAVRGSPAAERLVDPGLIPDPGSVRVAGIVGSELDPTTGVLHPDVTTYTLWGELAYQLGGVAGYRLVEESDRRTKAAPGSGLLDHLIGDRPTLILLDEIARYLRAAQAVPTGTGEGNVAGQTIAFLMSLLEFAASRQRVVVVLTLADPSDAFGQESEQLRAHLAEARRVAARNERVLTPAAEDETASIVAHRLFRTIDRHAAQEVSRAYLAAYATAVEHGAPLPHEVTTAAYAAQIERSYPFHPELLRVLSLRVGTIPNFQRTRGALRLLALVVRRLWEQRLLRLSLIHPHHVDLGFPPIVEDLTSRLDRPVFKQVIEADIVSQVPGHPAHAQSVDTAFLAAGRPPYGQRLATTIFLHSLVHGQAAGIQKPTLFANVLEPGDDPGALERALTELVERCWYLAAEREHYRFGTEVQLNKVIADEMAVVPVSLAKAKLEERIRQIWTRGALEPVTFPHEPADIPDDAGTPKLVIVHFDAATATAAEDAPPDFVRHLFEYAGSAGSYRRYRNNLVFLVCDQGQRSQLIDTARKYLAIERLNDPSRLADFTQEQQRRLRELREQTELELRVAITRAYRFLYYPSGDLAPGQSQLAREILPAQDQGTVRRAQTDVVVQALKRLEKVRTSDDQPLAPAYVRARAWSGQQGKVSTEEIRRTFAQRVNLPILLDPNVLKRIIRDGIVSGEWIYYDAATRKGYDKDSPLPTVELSEETYLYTPEEAARVGIEVERPRPKPNGNGDNGQKMATCPVCGQPAAQCVCGIVIERRERPVLEAAGVAPQAFQSLIDQAGDKRVERLARLELTLEASGAAAVQEIRALGLLLAQVPRARLRVDMQYIAGFSEDERVTLQFAGGLSRWQAVRQVVETVGGQASQAVLTVTVIAESEEDGFSVAEDVVGLRDYVEHLPFGKIALRAEAVEDGAEGKR